MKNILKVAPILLCAALSARAQISSPAFDPNCYQPRIGVPGEIDTIYGGYVGQELGGGLINIGPSPDNPGGAGRLMFGGLAGDKVIVGRGGAYSAVDCGPNFDPHHMTVAQFKGFWNGSKMMFGHFRSRKQNDILLLDSLSNPSDLRLFWADQEGNYDTSNWTLFEFQRKIGHARDGAVFHSYFSSDTAEDLILSYVIHTDFVHDSVIVALLHGGKEMYLPQGVAHSVEDVYVDSLHAFDPRFRGGNTGYQADFRGVGRDDYLSVDGRGSMTLFKNDPPFSLTRFVQAINFDTIFSAWDDPRLPRPGIGYPFGWNGILMHAFAKPNGDSSFDLVLPLDSNGGSHKDGQLRIFRGGPDFGSHRLTIDSAFTLHYPSAFDSNTFKNASWKSVFNAGDMTGTGRPVLGVYGLDFLTGIFAFYVLGDAIDEKVDMFFGGYGFSGSIDTCTIDGDGLQDLANGDEGYNVDGNLSGEDIGTVRFIHGSTKIPIHTGGVLRTEPTSSTIAVTRSLDGRTLQLQIPSPPSLCEAQLHDILGRIVLSSTIAVTSESTASLSLPILPRGMYVLEIRSGSTVYKAKLIL